MIRHRSQIPPDAMAVPSLPFFAGPMLFHAVYVWGRPPRPQSHIRRPRRDKFGGNFGLIDKCQRDRQHP